MAKKLTLVEAQRQGERCTVDGMIRACLGENRASEPAEIAELVVADLWDAMERGEAWADTMARARCRETIRVRAKQIVKASQRTVCVTNGEHVIDMTAYVSIPNPKPPPATQLRLWYDVTPEEFRQFYYGRARHFDVLGREMKMYHEVLESCELFPDAQTCGEACRLAGKDPDLMEIKTLVEVS